MLECIHPSGRTGWRISLTALQLAKPNATQRFSCSTFLGIDNEPLFQQDHLVLVLVWSTQRTMIL